MWGKEAKAGVRELWPQPHLSLDWVTLDKGWHLSRSWLPTKEGLSVPDGPTACCHSCTFPLVKSPLAFCWLLLLRTQQEFLGGLAVEDLALSLLRLAFSPWPGNFHMPQKKKKRTQDQQKVPSVAIKGFFFFVFLLFAAALTAYGGSHASSQPGATAASLHHSHSNTRSLAH